MSQVGYMFLALGVGAWSASIFHLVTHACFKALLFLGAGVIILSVHEEQDIFRMGGLARRMPLTFWTFLIGALSLASFPLVTAGFYSKDAILCQACTSATGSLWLWAGAWVGAFLTAALYLPHGFPGLFRRGENRRRACAKTCHGHPAGGAGHFLRLHRSHRPAAHAGRPALTSPIFSTRYCPASNSRMAELGTERLLLGLIRAGLAGRHFARLSALRAASRRGAGVRNSPLARLLFAGFGFDWLYHQLFVRPFLWFAQADKHDVIDYLFLGACAHEPAV